MKTNHTLKTILLVEDDLLIREVTKEALQAEGYLVVTAQDGQVAWETLRQVKPDLILSDVRMPQLDGFELLRRIRREHDHRATPFIIMSAKAETSDQRMGMGLGADDYVTKPYQPEDLLKTIKVRIERANLVTGVLSDHQQFLTRVLPHELRTPLAGIIGYADLMVDLGESGHTLSAEDLVDYGQTIARSGHRLLGVAEDCSLWSWLESAKSTKPPDGGFKLRQTQITAEAVRHWCQKCAEQYGRAADLAIDGQPVTVMVPEEGLARVIVHLVENAFKFSLPGAPVRVDIRGDEKAGEIRVTDGGRGMSEAELEGFGVMRQFRRERYEQQGIGMGLALARNFALIGGGNFTLEINSPGPGLTACLRLVLAAG